MQLDGIYKISDYFKGEELEELINNTDIYLKSLIIIEKIYGETLDAGGNLIVSHFTRVSECLETLEEKVTGLLHDIVEDKLITFDDLIYVGIPEYIVKTLRFLARDKGIYPNYCDYITSILESNNELAIKVKYADMSDNFNQDRLNLLEEDLKNRLVKKYRSQLPRLEQKVNEINKKIKCGKGNMYDRY